MRYCALRHGRASVVSDFFPDHLPVREHGKIADIVLRHSDPFVASLPSRSLLLMRCTGLCSERNEQDAEHAQADEKRKARHESALYVDHFWCSRFFPELGLDAGLKYEQINVTHGEIPHVVHSFDTHYYMLGCTNGHRWRDMGYGATERGAIC